MDLNLVLKGLDFSRKRNRWLLYFAAFGFSGYGFYRAYQSPVITQKGRRVLKLLGSLVSLAEAASDSASTIGILSKDLKVFLQSESDEIPISLKQISKIHMSKEFSNSLVKATQALTIGVVSGYRLGGRIQDGDGSNVDLSFVEQVMDKLLTKAGSGFASLVVGSFAKNLVMAFHSADSTGIGSVQTLVDLISSDQKCKQLIGDCVQLFVSTAIAVYLDKTMDINTFDQLFSGLTNPKHEVRVKHVLVDVCNGAVETLVKTSHQILTSDSHQQEQAVLAGDEIYEHELSAEAKDKTCSSGDGWIGKLSSALTEPVNKRFVLDLTGKVTFETVRSLLEFLLDRLNDCAERFVTVFYEGVVEGGLEVAQYVTAKYSAVARLVLSLYLRFLGTLWGLVPA